MTFGIFYLVPFVLSYLLNHDVQASASDAGYRWGPEFHAVFQRRAGRGSKLEPADDDAGHHWEQLPEKFAAHCIGGTVLLLEAVKGTG
jgi:hypothetical protein